MMPNLNENLVVARRPSGQPKRLFSVYLPTADLETVSRLAEEREVSSATIVRQALRGYLRNQP